MQLNSNLYKSKISSYVKTKKLPEQLKIASTTEDVHRIENFRKKLFQPFFSSSENYYSDRYDKYSLILFTENDKGDILSTARLIFDNEEGLPVDEYVKNKINIHRDTGLKLLEVSRFAIADEARTLGLFPIYYKAFYQLAAENNIDTIISIVSDKGINFHKKRVGTNTLLNNIYYGDDKNLPFSCLEWNIPNTNEEFLNWIGVKRFTDERYSILEWNGYSRSFASVMTHVQRELYHDAARYLTGSVIDLGAGAARLAPLLADNPDISHYTAVEYADDMVEIANFTLDKLDQPTFRVLHQKIEDTSGQFSSAVSLHSFYAWDDPVAVLRHIYDMLLPGSTFVLATPNKNLNQKKLYQDAKKELMWHPDFEIFKEYNIQLANNPSANFVSMDTLIRKVHQAGFEVCSAHTEHYSGGVNFLVMTKPV